LSVKLDVGLPGLFISAGLIDPKAVEFGAAGVAKEGLFDLIDKEAVACDVLDDSTPPVNLF
jgi:hypothetical protein